MAVHEPHEPTYLFLSTVDDRFADYCFVQANGRGHDQVIGLDDDRPPDERHHEREPPADEHRPIETGEKWAAFRWAARGIVKNMI